MWEIYIPRAEPVTIAVLGSFAVTAYWRLHCGIWVDARGMVESFGEACHSVLADRRKDMID